MHERIHAEALARNKQVPDRRDTTKWSRYLPNRVEWARIEAESIDSHEAELTRRCNRLADRRVR